MGTHRRPPSPASLRTTSVANALFTKVQQRVLGLLFGSPERSFYANEIIARVDCGTGAVQRELARLADAGLVTVSRVGNQKHFQANPHASVFAELRGLVLKTVGLADDLRVALMPLADRIRAAFVYGSIPKGDDTATSDIDLMVISEHLDYSDLFASLEASARRLGRTVNPTIYSPAELARRIRQHNAFVTRVLAQPKLWLIGSEHDLST